MPFAAALSEHPVPAHAAGEVIGTVLEGVGPAPDLAVVFVTGPHAGALDDIAATVRATLAPRVLIGCAAVSVVGGGREVEEHAAVVLWAGRFAPVAPSAAIPPVAPVPPVPPVAPVRLEALTTGDGVVLTGLPDHIEEGAALLLLADPFSFPADDVLAAVAQRWPTLTVVGGLASAARGPGGNRLVVDGQVVTDGAVGAVLPPGTLAGTVVSQGCRPIGDPWAVTKAERNVIYELGGRPALDRLMEMVEVLGEDERRSAARGLHLGRVVDESKAEFRRGDFLIRNVLGADKSVGAVAVGDTVEVGDTVQFQVRDAASADEDLRELLAGVDARGALVFTCNGRGTHLFGEPDHDAGLVATVVGSATAGMFCAGEIGPVGDRAFLHGFTASVALFSDAAPT